MVLWARDPAVAAEVEADRTNSRHLPGAHIDSRVHATADLHEAVTGAVAVLVAVPTVAMRPTVEALASSLTPGVPVVSLAKGFEPGTGLRMSEVVAELAPGRPVAALTGPNLAREILDGHAAASVLACDDDEVGARLQELLSTDWFRIYRNTDLVGCELAGALKNVVAIAAGMAEGLGAGDNTRAAVMTRGLAELAPARGGDGGQPAHVLGPGRARRPRGHLRQPAEPQPARRRAAGPGPAARRDPRHRARRGRRRDGRAGGGGARRPPRRGGADRRPGRRRAGRPDHRGGGVPGPARASAPGRSFYRIGLTGRSGSVGPMSTVPDDELLPWWWQRQVDPSSPDVVPGAASGESSTHRNWVLLGTVGGSERAVVDPRGAVTPWPGGWSLDWWVGADDTWHLPARAAGVRQRLMGDAPVVETVARVPGGELHHRCWAVAAGEGVPEGGAVVVELENALARPGGGRARRAPVRPAGPCPGVVDHPRRFGGVGRRPSRRGAAEGAVTVRGG